MSETSNEGPKTFSFSKKEKLKNKKLFEELFIGGKGISAFPVKLLYVRTQFDDGPHIKVGVVAPKKKFKSAVKRNRIKRLLREAYRLNKHLVFNNIEGDFAFLFLYLGKQMPTFEEVDTSIKQLLKGFLKKESHEKID
ncbi:Ribonuclease P [Flagellimonas maritima]|uniref:Ribonuclease P protein component n=1 Tax=Flagellimonas maritima TaxID=1383885 RepID=A0A2Z4LRG5_9FLAO|nr:ribonuclease P protein component [Allomuricauda aurantiaca]AWX44475.1 Ribonuclease P [Allomuricauda aurantiaca]